MREDDDLRGAGAGWQPRTFFNGPPLVKPWDSINGWKFPIDSMAKMSTNLDSVYFV